jgi:hypothetical protein
VEVKSEAIKETGKNIQSLANLLMALSFINLYLNHKINDIIAIAIGVSSMILYIIGYILIDKGSSNE